MGGHLAFVIVCFLCSAPLRTCWPLRLNRALPPRQAAELERRRRLYRWPFPLEHLRVLKEHGVDVNDLQRRCEDKGTVAGSSMKVGTADDLRYRLRFLGEQLSRGPHELDDHPQYLWSRFEGHVLPRVLYARHLGVLQELNLRQLLGTRDTSRRDA